MYKNNTIRLYMKRKANVILGKSCRNMSTAILWYNSIAANHSDFGGILPIFKQYSAHSDRNDRIPPKFKKFCCITVKTMLKVASRVILLNMLCKRCIPSNIVWVILLPVTAFVIGW